MRHVLLAVAAIGIAAAASAHEAPEQNSGEIHAQGCVEQGVEARCLMVKDLKSGNLYNVMIKGLHPEVGMGVEFTGTRHDGPTACMQGIAVDVASWARKDSLKCAKGEAPKP